MASTIVVNPDQVKLIRKGLFSRIKEDDYDEKDIERYKTQDAQVARHIRSNSKKSGQELIDETVSLMVDMLEWRAEMDVANASDYSFSPQIVKAHEKFLIEGGTEKKGQSKCFWYRVEHWKDDYFYKIPDGKRYEAYMIEKMDNETFNDRGFAYWMDYSNASLSNLPSLETTKYSLKVMSFYNGGMKYLAFYNAPKFFSSTWPIIAPLASDAVERTFLVSKDELNEYMDASEVPKEIK